MQFHLFELVQACELPQTKASLAAATYQAAVLVPPVGNPMLSELIRFLWDHFGIAI